MSTATEIERLVVKLVTDAAQYETALESAEERAAAAAKKIEAAAKEAMRQQDAAFREAAAITDAVATPLERHEAHLKKLDAARDRGRISQQTYDRAVKAAKDTLESYDAELQEARQIHEAMRTPQERHAAGLERLNALKKTGKLSQESYNRAVAQSRRQLPEVIAAERRKAEAMERGKAVYRETRTAAERYAKELANVRRLYRQGAISADVYRRKTRMIGKDFDFVGKRINAFTGGLRGASSNLLMFGAGLSISVTAPLLGIAAAATKAGSDIDSAFAGLRKTVDASEEELQSIKAEFESLVLSGTPFNLTELLDIGAAGGQLGIDTSNIVSFTKTIADLKVTTNLGDEAATTLARIANISGLPQNEFDRLGSTIVALGNSTATTEAEIASLMLRLTGAGRQIGLDITQVAALSASLSSVGIEAEAGGTAFSQLFLRLATAAATGGEELEAFARTAGMSAEQFKASFQDDAGGAVLALLQRLKEMQGEEAILALQEMGVEGARMTDAVLRSASAIEVLEEALTTAKTAYDENTALAAEAEIRYGSFASQVSNLWGQLKIVGQEIYRVLAPYILMLVDYVKQGVAWFLQLSDGVKTAIVAIGAIVAAVGPLLVMLGTVVGVIASIVAAVATLGTGALVFAAVAAGTAVWLAELAAIGTAIGAAVYWLVGADGLASAWGVVSDYAAKAFHTIVGFLMNFQTNARIAIDWFRNNWKSALADIVAATPRVFLNLIHNLRTAIDVGNKLFAAFVGYMLVQSQNFFLSTLPAATIEGLRTLGTLLMRFAQENANFLIDIITGRASATDTKAFYDGLGEAFVAGARSSNFSETASKIISDGFAEMRNPLEGVNIATGGPEFVYAYGRESIGKPLAEGVVEGAKNGAMGAGEVIVRELTAAEKAVASYTEKLREEIETFGLSAREIEVYKLKKIGATEATLRGVHAMHRELDALEAAEKFREEGAAIVEQFKTPAEKYRDRMAELTKHLARGTIDMRTFRKAFVEARETLRGGLNVDFSVSGVEAVEAGSAEALQRAQAFYEGGGGRRGLKAIREGRAVASLIDRGRGVVPGRAEGGAVVAEGRSRAGTTPDGRHEARVESLLTSIAAHTDPRNPDRPTKAIMPANLSQQGNG